MVDLSILAADAIYENYKFNRTSFPKWTPEEWGRVFVNWEELEERYQQELRGAK